MDLTKNIQRCLADLAALHVFAGLRSKPLMETFGALLETELSVSAGLNHAKNDTIKPEHSVHFDGALKFSTAWSAFTGSFIAAQTLVSAGCSSFYTLIAEMTLYDENVFTLALEKDPVFLPQFLRVAAAADLNRLGNIAVFDLSALGFRGAEILRSSGLGEASRRMEAEARAFWAADSEEGAPFIFPRGDSWETVMPKLAEHIRHSGAGNLGRYHSFIWSGNDSNIPLRPVPGPDPISLSDLSGYEDQRKMVLDNTLRLLNDKPANNLLLYGDRGTGKSATVKAVANDLKDRGLRLLELHRNDLGDLPRIMETLSRRPLPFIIFIDDLSFESAGGPFTDLKALLEGGVEKQPPNTAVYATSNRRHFIKERHGDRPGPGAAENGDVRSFDTMQEQLSLADRFGLTVIYLSPNQDTYLSIAEFIARKRGLLSGGAEELQWFRKNALHWERWFNGRSPRTAVQYVDWLSGSGGDNRFPWD
ncbi:MAG: ATP-binding protein [Treponema sp.]|jgi:predicted AAA+ superfamily ATPase|nr:ATP-binding protein [Treponema sp.]